MKQEHWPEMGLLSFTVKSIIITRSSNIKQITLHLKAVTNLGKKTQALS